MAGVTLYDYQLDAVKRMKIGCILCGGVGSGKSRTSLAFYYTLYDGQVNTKNYVKMMEPPDLYIITTARKRDTGEWDEELAHFYMSTDPERDIYEHSVVVDSWNNIGKYVGAKNAFFNKAKELVHHKAVHICDNGNIGVGVFTGFERVDIGD